MSRNPQGTTSLRARCALWLALLCVGGARVRLPESRQTGGGAQFERLCLLCAGDVEGACFDLFAILHDLFRALQPDFEMNIIEGAGHWVAYEAADAFNAKLIEVLTR